MSTKTVTRKQAETVLELVKEKYKAYIGDDGKYVPVLIENWDWLASGPTPFAIVWEDGGPDDWAINFGGGSYDWEVFELAKDIYGDTPEGREKALQMATVEGVPDPDGVFTEPVTGWALGIYPA